MTFQPRRLDLRGAPEADLSDVVAHVERGAPLAYPTETVYGLGGSMAPEAVARVRELKGREGGKPLIALVESIEAVEDLAWSDVSRELATVFWPGSVTLVLEDPLGIFPSGVRDEERGTVGIRVSPHPLVARLVSVVGGPLTSTSLNVRGEPPVASGEQAIGVARRMDGHDVLVLDVGTLPPSGPSTVVDCTRSEPVVLREGTVPTDRLRCLIPEIHDRAR